jgi:hypothetical protein
MRKAGLVASTYQGFSFSALGKQLTTRDCTSSSGCPAMARTRAPSALAYSFPAPVTRSSFPNQKSPSGNLRNALGRWTPVCPSPTSAVICCSRTTI